MFKNIFIQVMIFTNVFPADVVEIDVNYICPWNILFYIVNKGLHET